MFKVKVLTNIAKLFALTMVMGLSSIQADDTEIFFGESKVANMVLTIDESGSMAFYETGGYYEAVTGTAPENELIVAPWTQSKQEGVSKAREKLPDYEAVGANPKIRFATLQVKVYWGQSGQDEWVDYVPYYTQSGTILPLADWDLTKLHKGYEYRWYYKDNRMTRLKEALYAFLSDPDTKDVHQLGMMGYTSHRNPEAKLLQHVRPLGKVTSGLTHRQHMINSIHELEPQFGTPTAEGYIEAMHYLGGAYTQNGSAVPSPILDGTCGYNSSVVLLTDGLPTFFDSGAYSDYKKVVGACDSSVNSGSQTSTNNGKECVIKLSEHYFVNDVKSNFPGSTVQTSVIKFAVNDPVADKFLYDTASTVDGSKLYYSASNIPELIKAFKESLDAIQDSTSFVAPSVPLSQSNRLQHDNHLYLGMFRPESKETWFGNLKKYQLVDGLIKDKNGLLAVDPNTGKFIRESVSFWGATQDGNQIDLGGALSKISTGDSSKVYTNLTNDSLDLLSPQNVTDLISSYASEPDFQDRLFDSDTTTNVKDLSDEKILSYYEWIRNRVTEVDLAEVNRFGDALHSKPEILTYDDGSALAFVTTNQGYIHAIDIETGFEKWAFLPRQMMKNVPRWQANPDMLTSEQRTYGIDGQIMVHSFKDASGAKKHYLYVGMRRGGSYLYALDVTSTAKPTMLFTVSDQFEFSKDELGYLGEKRTIIPELGQTWSRPAVVKMHDGNAAGYSKRLVIAGGYDPYYDDRANPVNPINGSVKGNAIYDVPFNGSTSSSNFRTTASSSIVKNSIAGNLTFIDVDNDQILDHLYAADVGGKIYRVDFTEKSSSKSVKVFADVSSDSDGSYRFYNKPDVAFASYQQQRFAVVALGSGHRVNPKARDTQDKFYAFYDFEVTGAKTNVSTISPNSLFDVTNTMTDPTTGEVRFPSVSDILSTSNPKSGWSLSLQTSEKVLSSATTVAGNLFFTTYLPAQAASCGVTSGTNRLYGIGLLDGAPSVSGFETGETAEHDDRYQGVKYVGIAPGATFLFPNDTTIATLVGTQTICTGDDCDFFKGGVKTVKWRQKE